MSNKHFIWIHHLLTTLLVMGMGGLGSTNSFAQKSKVVQYDSCENLLYEGYLLNDSVRVGQWDVFLNGDWVAAYHYNQKGVKDGPAIEHYSNSEESIGCYWQGTIYGIWFHSSHDQIKTIAHYMNDTTLHREYVAFLEDGTLKNRYYYLYNVPEGSYFEKYDNGNLKEVGSYIDGKKVGAWKEFRSDGTPIQEGVWKNERKHGAWSYYYHNGQLKETEYYEEGMLNSLGDFYTMDGQKVNNGWLTEGEGRRYFFNASGQVIAKGSYKNGLLDGTFTTYNKKEKVVSMVYYQNGIKQGDFESFHSNRTTEEKGRYEQGLKQGRWVKYYNHGRKKVEGVYLHGKKEGNWSYYNSKGSLDSLLNYKDGILEGLQRYIDKKANLITEIHYNQGIKEGYYRKFNSNNILQEEGIYKEGLKTGMWIMYHPKQKENIVFSKTQYVLGMKNGIYEEFDNKGRKVKEGYFNQNKKVNTWKILHPRSQKVVEEVHYPS